MAKDKLVIPAETPADLVPIRIPFGQILEGDILGESLGFRAVERIPLPVKPRPAPPPQTTDPNAPPPPQPNRPSRPKKEKKEEEEPARLVAQGDAIARNKRITREDFDQLRRTAGLINAPRRVLVYRADHRLYPSDVTPHSFPYAVRARTRKLFEVLRPTYEAADRYFAGIDYDDVARVLAGTRPRFITRHQSTFRQSLVEARFEHLFASIDFLTNDLTLMTDEALATWLFEESNWWVTDGGGRYKNVRYVEAIAMGVKAAIFGKLMGCTPEDQKRLFVSGFLHLVGEAAAAGASQKREELLKRSQELSYRMLVDLNGHPMLGVDREEAQAVFAWTIRNDGVGQLSLPSARSLGFFVGEEFLDGYHDRNLLFEGQLMSRDEFQILAKNLGDTGRKVEASEVQQVEVKSLGTVAPALRAAKLLARNETFELERDMPDLEARLEAFIADSEIRLDYVAKLAKTLRCFPSSTMVSFEAEAGGGLKAEDNISGYKGIVVREPSRKYFAIVCEDAFGKPLRTDIPVGDRYRIFKATRTGLTEGRFVRYVEVDVKKMRLAEQRFAAVSVTIEGIDPVRYRVIREALRPVLPYRK